MNKPQIWYCDDCRALGVVMVGDVEDIWSVYTRIKDAHRGAAPGCTSCERVIVEPNMDKDRILMMGRVWGSRGDALQ